MRTFPLSLCVLLASVSFAIAQEKVSMVTPVSEAEVSETTFPNALTLILTLKTPEDGETSVLLDDIDFGECTASIGSRTATVAVVDTNDPKDQIHKICNFTLGSTATTLPPEWDKFELKMSYRVRENGTFGAWKTVRLGAISRCVRASGVMAKLGDPSRTGDRDITIPVEINSDVRLKVDLKKGDTPVASASSGGLMFEKKIARPVVLKVVDGVLLEPGTTYTLSISQLPSQPPIQIKFSDEGSPEKFRIPDYVEYKMSRPELKKNDEGSVQVKFKTETEGSVEVLINGKKAYSDPRKQERDFTIPAELVRPDVNVLTFSGQSTQNRLPLTGNDPQAFSMELKPSLTEKSVIIGYDELANKLKIEFSLSRNMALRWQFKDRDGLGADVKPTNEANRTYLVEIDLNLTGGNAELVESKLQDDASSALRRAPVEVEIVNANNSKQRIASFKVDFIKPKEAVLKKLKDANAQAAGGHDEAAKKLLAQAFGSSVDNETLSALYAQLRKPEVDLKTKVYRVLGLVGRIGAGIFGIPLPV